MFILWREYKIYVKYSNIGKQTSIVMVMGNLPCLHMKNK